MGARQGEQLAEPCVGLGALVGDPAELAVRLSEHLDDGAVATRVRALAELGNARRIAGAAEAA